MTSVRDPERFAALVDRAPLGRFVGRVTRVVGLLVECGGIHASLGELCEIRSRGRIQPLLAEVVGFRDGGTLVMPIGDAQGLGPGSRVRPLSRRLSIRAGDFLLGRVVDALGEPMDGKGAFPRGIAVDIERPAPSPLERAPIERPLPTGVSVIDGFLTLGRGQRVGIFAGSGVGKSTLLATIARETLADVNVIALIGERGSEVEPFIRRVLRDAGLRKSVLVVATSDQPPYLRFKAAFTAVAIAEYYRDRGRDVMLMMDSVTRLAGAAREIGLALGEPPTVKGYPPSFYSTMPRLLERLGRTMRGSITGLINVLVDQDDMNDPVADTCRAILDGHIVLSRTLFERGVHPAVDVAQSVSRVMGLVASSEHREAARRLRELLSVYEEHRDLLTIGAWREGGNPVLDRAVRLQPGIQRLVAQAGEGGRPFDATVAEMVALTKDLR